MLERLGATAVCVMNVSGADPRGMLRSYGADVLPALRGDLSLVSYPKTLLSRFLGQELSTRRMA